MLLVVQLLALATYGMSEPVWEDNFNTLNTSNWFIEVVQNPYNNELQYYTNRPENIKTENGNLVITPLKEKYGGKGYTSGRMYSKINWKYGRVDVRAKLPNGYGLWPAIWMMSSDEIYGGWPTSGEIDIVEARGQNNHEFASTIHYGICCDNHYYETSRDLPHQCNNDQYHVYSLDWTPTKLVYRYDDKPYFEQNLDRVISWMYNTTGQPFDQPFHIILNVAVGGNYLDDPKPNTEWSYPDALMLVDYVKVYTLEDIADETCQVVSGADSSEVCASLKWICYGQTNANVSSECTQQLMNCCNSTTTCDSNTLHSLASLVYASYHAQTNGEKSCDFNGTSRKYYKLRDGEVRTYNSQCLIRKNADGAKICNAMKWACNNQNYANVSSECDAGFNILTCCEIDPYICDSSRLRERAQFVFQSYYNQLLHPSSCDFSGICYLENPRPPLECTDGYGA